MVDFRLSRPTLMSRANRAVGWAFFVLLLMAIPVFFGLVLSLSVLVFDLVLVGLIAGIILLFLPINVLMAVFLITVFIFTGLFSYFSGLSPVLWTPYLMGFIFFIRLPVELIRLRRLEAQQKLEYMPDHSVRTVVILPFIAYVFIIAFSTLVNLPPFFQVFLGIRSYLFLWSVMLILGYATIDHKVFDRIWRFFVFFAFLQFPFVLFQLLYVVQIKGSNWDAITGTFGGYITGEGGFSGGMALFLMMIFTYGLTLWRDGFWSGRRILVFLIAMLGTLMLAEVKVVMGVIPVIIVLTLWRRIFAKPVEGILIILGLTVALVAILMSYQKLFWGENIGLNEEVEWSSKLERTIEYVFAMESDAGFVNLETREVSRIGAIYVWIQEHRARYGPAQALIGHGPGASRIGALMGEGTAAAEYPFTLMTHTASMELWDFGFLGFLAFVSFFAAGSYRAYRLSKNDYIPPRTRSTLSAIALILFLSIPFMFYNPATVDTSQQQTWLAVLFGQVIFWDLVTKGKRARESKRIGFRRKPIESSVGSVDALGLARENTV